LLDRKFNWQWYFKDFDQWPDNAHIVHLASCNDKIAVAKSIIGQLTPV
jgi:hypothetical protein